MKIINVNMHIIHSNTKHGLNNPPIRIQEGRKITYCMGVKIHGDSELVYNPNKPLNCGARLWIKTDSDIEVTNK